jgi:hypothetical protein
MTYITEQFGPIYDVDSATLKKYRRNGGCCKAHGEAVLVAVRSSQQACLKRAAVPAARPNTASRTYHSDGGAILKAVAAQHTAATQAWPAQIRRARTRQQWEELYEIAMAEKGK